MEMIELAPPPARATPRGLGLVRRAFLPRVVGLGIGALCAGAGLHQADAPPWVWGVLIVYCFGWPHVALRVGLRSAAPIEAERRNVLVDAFAGGFWVVAMAFNVLPSVLLLAALAMNNFATGGARLFRSGVVAHLAGAGLALLTVGFQFRPETSFSTVLWCVPFLLTYPLVLGVVMYRLSIELSRRKDELVLEKRRADEANLAKTRLLAELASRDELTGLHNRRHMSELLAKQRLACLRGGEGFAVALVDLDHFKQINDTHGHAVGDSVLRAFAEHAGAAMRGTDTVGRWGGEEFLVIYPRSTAHEAAQGAARLRERVAAAVMALPEGRSLRFTVSIGIAEHVPSEPVEALLERADRAMYQAKSQGRDRVVTLPSLTPTGEATYDPAMDAEAFRRELAELGYPEVLTREWPPNHFVDTHTHDFAVRALVLEGEFVLTCEGRSQRYAAGEIFTLEPRVPHQEQYGPDGAVYLVGRRAA